VTARRLAAVAAVVVAVVVGWAAPAFAHATLESTNPPDGTVLATAPAEVTLTFSESVRLPDGGLRVFDDQGVRADDGRPGKGADDRTIRVGLGDSLHNGTYLVSWRVISADSHVVSGAFSFSLGEPTTAPSQLASEVKPPSNRPWTVAGDVARFFGYAGALLAVGGIAFLGFASQAAATRAERRLLVGAAVVSLLAAAAGVVFQTVVASGLGSRAATDTALIGDTLRDQFGTSAIVRAVGLVVLAIGVVLGTRREGRSRYAVAGVGALITLLSFPLTGHTRSTSPRALIFGADLVHLAAASVWVGGLAFLGFAIRRRQDDRPNRKVLAQTVSRYSVMATSAVFALAAAGLLFAWKQTGSIDALTSTRYGALLIAKVILALAVGGVGLYNNRVLVPAIEVNPSRGPVRELGRTVRAEVIVLLGVIAVTAVLVNVKPAREAVAATSGPYFARVDLDDTHQLDIELVPAKAGPNEAHLNIYQDGLPADIAQEVTVRMRLPEQGIGPLEHEATRLAPGHWVVRLDDLTIPGKWQMDVVARVSDFDQLTSTSVVEIGS
jgi:copper transport protein